MIVKLDDQAATASYMGTATDGSDITKVGSNDNNLNGTRGGFDAGLEFGTSGLGKDDIGTVTFTINYLTLSEIDGQSFGIRATSVGENRTDSVKLISEFDVTGTNDAPTVSATAASGVHRGCGCERAGPERQRHGQLRRHRRQRRGGHQRELEQRHRLERRARIDAGAGGGAGGGLQRRARPMRRRRAARRGATRSTTPPWTSSTRVKRITFSYTVTATDNAARPPPTR